jgi:HK97 family phage prohead protease
MTSTKTVEAHFKTFDDEQGTFEAVVSVFGNIDYQGDRCMPGCFEDHLKSLRQKGAKIPVVWSHDWGNPFAHVGYVDARDAMEITFDQAKAKGFGDILGGLYVKGHIDIHKEFARQVYDLLKDGRVNEWSFAYDVVEEERAKDHANNLLRLKVWEVGPTLKGANDLTATLAVKSSTAKAEPSKLYRHLQLYHGYPVSGLATRTSKELGELHRELHADGRIPSHSVSDILLPDDERAPLPRAREASLLAELAELSAVAKAPRTGELSAGAQEFLAQVKPQEHDDDVQRRINASSMARMTLAEHYAAEEARDRAEHERFKREHNIVEGETIRVTPDEPSPTTRVSWDDLLDGNAGPGTFRPDWSDDV